MTRAALAQAGGHLCGVATAGAAGVAWLPWLLFALPGGVLVDRVDRRRLMVLIDWIGSVGKRAGLGCA